MSFCTASGGKLQDMKPLSSKRMIRIEKKKKKMAALLEISKLNEYDRATKNARMALNKEGSVQISQETEPSPKRFKTETSEDKKINNGPDVQPMDIDTPVTDGDQSQYQDIGSSGKPKVYGDELLRLKKLLREKTKKMRDQPTFRLREYGELASLSTDIDTRMPLFLSDVQHLVMYSQLGAHSPYSPAKWCQLEKHTKVAHTNVLIVENVSAYNYLNNETSFSFIRDTFDHKLEIVSPEAYKADIVQDFSMVPITGTQMRKFIDQYGSLEEAVSKSFEVFDMVKNLFPLDKHEIIGESLATQSNLPPNDKFPRTQLLLSGWQLIEENFPLPIKGLMERKYPGYILTKDKYKEVTPFSPMFGVDCEMCRTDTGDLELTRISIVDENMQVFYEQLVKPDNKIVDYLTKYSGITAKMMKHVTKRLSEVQEDLRRLLPEDAILVGQSLSNDLHALKMMHPYIIDTSVIYNITGNRTRKTKLQTLTRYFLNERIQEGHGHCSVEDSQASLKLAQHKLANNLCYGDVLLSGVKEHFKKHPELGNLNYATSMLKQTTRMEKTAQVISLEELIPKYEYYTHKGNKNYEMNKTNYVEEKTNEDVVKRFCDTNMQYTLNVGHVRISDSQLERDPTLICDSVNSWVKQIYDRTSMPSLTIVIFSGHGSANGCCFIQLKRLPY